MNEMLFKKLKSIVKLAFFTGFEPAASLLNLHETRQVFYWVLVAFRMINLANFEEILIGRN